MSEQNVKRGRKKGEAIYPQELQDEIRAAYEAAGDTGLVGLKAIAEKWGKDAGNLARAAKRMGFVMSANRTNGRKDTRKFKGDAAALAEGLSAAAKARIARDGHPRHMLGKKHTAEVRRILGEVSARRWASLTEQQRSDHTMKALKTKVAKGIPVAHRGARGSWKAGWREIGGKRNYYRSRWEANYARWLEHLKLAGDIEDWQHEPETFWFDGILRGVRSYKPDFRVVDDVGTRTLHEVKGWMDARSRTTLKRMAKYHPHEVIILIREPAYKQIARNFSHLIEGWEA